DCEAAHDELKVSRRFICCTGESAAGERRQRLESSPFFNFPLLARTIQQSTARGRALTSAHRENPAPPSRSENIAARSQQTRMSLCARPDEMIFGPREIILGP